jgi:hypothetical protein
VVGPTIVLRIEAREMLSPTEINQEIRRARTGAFETDFARPDSSRRNSETGAASKNGEEADWW